MNFKLNLDFQCVHCWYYKINPTSKNLAYYEELIKPEERDRGNRFKFRKDKEVYITARAILRILIGHYLNANPKEISFAYNEFNKPRYAGVNSLKFNISHSGNIIVLGFVKGHEIGVDIEKIKDDFDVMDIAQNFFSFKEIKALKSLPENEQNLAFYRCWTRKESFIKAEGSGLSFPLDSFSVSLDNDKYAELLETKWDSSERKKWNLISFTPANGYAGAIAVRGKIKSINYYNFDKIL